MAQVSVSDKQISVKIVYYGPGLSGKTTNLLYIHQRVASKNTTEMVSIATEGDRTLYFDFLPLKTNIVPNFTTKIQLYTVPGQVQYNATRRLVLQGADGIVFVEDSQWSRQKDNAESFYNMKENLKEDGIEIQDIPYVLEYNKRDLNDIANVQYMDYLLNRESVRVPSFETIATEGQGVFDALNTISRMVMAKLIKELKENQ